MRTCAKDCPRKLFPKTIYREKGKGFNIVSFFFNKQTTESEFFEISIWQCSGEEAGQGLRKGQLSVRIP